eukprot:6180503-Pleurochrysis_carterae.AAC.1
MLERESNIPFTQPARRVHGTATGDLVNKLVVHAVVSGISSSEQHKSFRAVHLSSKPAWKAHGWATAGTAHSGGASGSSSRSSSEHSITSQFIRFRPPSKL